MNYFSFIKPNALYLVIVIKVVDKQVHVLVERENISLTISQILIIAFYVGRLLSLGTSHIFLRNLF